MTHAFYKALTKHFLLTLHSIIIVTIHTVADLKKQKQKTNCLCFHKTDLRLIVYKKSIFLKLMMHSLRELGMSKREQIDVCNPIVPIDLHMGE